MSAEQGGGGQAGSQTLFLVLIMFFGTIGAAALIWHFKHAQLVSGLFKLKLLELKLFTLLHIPPAVKTAEMLKQAIDGASNVTFGNFILGLTLPGFFLIPFVFTSFVYLAWKANNHPVRLAYRELNASGLLEAMSKNFSYVAPVLKLDLISNKVPGWEPTISPIEFVEKYGLLTLGELDVSRTEKLFAARLGPRMKSPLELKRPHERILMALFAEAAWGSRKEAFRWLDKLNWASSNDKGRPVFDAELVGFFEPFFKKWAKDKRVLEQFSYHVYRDTFLSQLLFCARNMGNKGKLPTSFFLWLRPTDRQLYYVLNQEGRDTAWAEGLHAYHQLQSERVAQSNGWRLTTQYFKGATKGLEAELQKVNFIRPKQQAEDLFAAETAPVAQNLRKTTTSRRRS